MICTGPRRHCICLLSLSVYLGWGLLYLLCTAMQCDSHLASHGPGAQEPQWHGATEACLLAHPPFD